MKFGKKWGSLRYEPWLSHYTDYKQLKKILKTSGPEGHFNFKFCLTNALKESNAFFVQTEQSFLKQYETEIKDIAVDETTTTAAHALATDVERLRDFAILNYLAVRGAGVKDGVCGASNESQIVLAASLHFKTQQPTPEA